MTAISSFHVSPDPIIVERDDNGVYHFATNARPMRIVVDVHNLMVGFGWMKLDTLRKTITISLDGEVLMYHRIGKDLHGWWVCDRVQHGHKLQGSDHASEDVQS